MSIVILGLGSNIGDRLAHLRAALSALKQLANLTVEAVSPVYLSDAMLPENAPADWNMSYLNIAIRCETTQSPFDLLKALKSIEHHIGRTPTIRHWGPRIIDIDILAMDKLVIKTDELTIPHHDLSTRPFALWPFTDVAPYWMYPEAVDLIEPWGSRFSGDAPFSTRQINQRIDTPRLMGIINITPDSFSDGGTYQHIDHAIQHAIDLVKAGADVLDIGAESTRPGASPIDAETEWERLSPLLSAINSMRHTFVVPPTISIDTRHAATAKKALAMGINIINDVSGLDDPAMRDVVIQSGVDCVVMHHIRIPEDRAYVLARHEDPVKLVYAWGEKRLHELEKAGLSPEKIIFDPGIGFGKLAEHSLWLLQQAHVFKQLGTRVLIGHSRKTFLSLASSLPVAERDIETMTLSLYLAKQGIDYLRVHNIDMTARGLRTQSITSA